MNTYIAWLMVAWLNGKSEPFTVIGAYKGYDQCVSEITKMSLALKIPEGVKVDCIDKPYKQGG